MSTAQTTNDQFTDVPNFCEHCGNALQAGRFCPECGKPVAALSGPPAGERAFDQRDGYDSSDPADAARTAPWATPPAPAQPAATDRASKRRVAPVLIAGVLAGLVPIAAAIAAVVLLSSSKGDTVYKQKVAAAFGPVLGANRQLSNSLAQLRGSRMKGTRAANARAAVRRAQQATTTATGAISALSAPARSEQLARDARQVLDRERAYLSAVASVLGHAPTTTTSQTSELQTLESDLTSAFSVAGPTVRGKGTQPTVSGSDRLASWALAIHRNHVRAVRGGNGNTGGTTTTGATGQVSRTPSGAPCGGGVFAGPNTSCPFAFNVRDAYNEAPGSHATVRVFSPVTDTTYTMTCAPSGSGVTCSGGNNASVTF